MSFLQFPPERQEEVMRCVEDKKTIITLLTVNHEISDLARTRWFQYLLENGLNEIIRTSDIQKMEKWKQVVFDTFPRGHPTRKIIIQALFFLLGRHNYPIYHWVSFYPLICPSDFTHLWVLGWLFRPYAYQLADTVTRQVKKMKKRIQHDPIKVLQNALFEKIVQIPDLQNAVKNRLKELTELADFNKAWELVKQLF